MSVFGDQAASFATTREQHAIVQARLAERAAEMGREGVHMAVELISLGYGDVVLDLMLSVLDEQAALLKIRRLEVVA